MSDQAIFWGYVPVDFESTPIFRSLSKHLMAPKLRKKRAKSVSFDTLVMRADLAKYAVMRDTSFSWSGSHYSKPVRSLGPDVEGLE